MLNTLSFSPAHGGQLSYFNGVAFKIFKYSPGIPVYKFVLHILGTPREHLAEKHFIIKGAQPEYLQIKYFLLEMFILNTFIRIIV